ncbi:hypothetical protein KJZ71_04470 [Patescibacteria group bacterium]|uniref:Uncharacterized protein n=1 Tax=candidate division WWE3 bacterium TaxID=2053526 RepID=A0A928Y5A8_UNCKA|nr:hypothetical protein [candidate division WWE3 bacterium]MCL4733025.1 hypothetical protein [Patescibacteria group bacterium]MDL1953298.1 hypothetical protein [Candidatus Uhrbacteria bacterium UHB]RIL00527.1 MAG: hypothetical protein DCC77_03120 [Candidatus Uhrbacteria bacterium]
MKRLIVFLVFLLAVGGGMLWYFVFRVTPEKAIQDAFQNLSIAQTAQTVQASVFWDIRASGGGFVLDKWLSFAGSADLRDPARPRLRGVAGFSQNGRADGFQSFDAVLASDAVAFRLREVSTGTEEYVRTLAATSTNARWFSFDRDILLDKAGMKAFRSTGNGSDIRAALKASGISSVAVPIGSVAETAEQGRRVLNMSLRIQPAAVETVLLSLVGAWNLRNPHPDEVAWVKRSAAGAAKGTWYASIDRDSRTFRSLQGSWPMLDDAGNEIGHITAEFAFSGWNASVNTDLPEERMDLTGRIVQLGLRSFTPAEIRQGEVLIPTSTAPPAGQRQDAYDVFGQYLEQVRKKRELY